MTVTYHAGRRIQGTQADFDGTPAVAGGWVEVGRTTLGSAGDTISVASLPNKRYYMFLNDLTATGGAISAILRLNNDSGTNYARRRSINGGSDNAYPNDINMTLNGNTDTNPRFDVGYLANLSSKEKLNITHGVYQNSSGAGTSPTRTEIVNKWANTSDAINRVDVINNSGAGSFDTNSECVVLGWDPSDTHTTNFWEELASVELGADGDNLSSGTISAKKYLWVQAAIMTSSAGSNVKHQITFNNDTGSNYAQRYSYSGTSDLTLTSRANWQFSAGSNNKGIAFLNFFIINNSANEKLCIGHTVMGDTAGAANAPRREEAVAKWTNTTDQITEIDIDQTLASIDYKAGSIIKVWGSD